MRYKITDTTTNKTTQINLLFFEYHEHKKRHEIVLDTANTSNAPFWSVDINKLTILLQLLRLLISRLH